MWQRFTFYDVRVIGHYLGVLVLFFSLAYVPPFIVALICGEWEPAARYLSTAGISLICGSGMRFMRIEPGRLNRQQALAVTGLAWIVLALFASVPLFFSGHYATYLDALFDGVSGLTTTGATVVVDLDHLSNADNMFRFMMHLLGGLGLIVVALSLGLFGKGGGASLYSSEGRSEHVVPNVVQTARFIARIAAAYVAVGTIVVAAICLFHGMEPLRAVLQSLWLSISGFMTGGFAPMSQSVMYYHSFSLELVLMVLMILGAINFVLHAEINRGNVSDFFRDMEIRTMVIWLATITCIFAASLTAGGAFSDLPAMLRGGLFMLISAFTTTGFQNITTNELVTVFTSGAFLVVAIAMAVGGSAGSTSGGMKLHRIGVVFKTIVAAVKETLAPDSARVVVTYNHVGRRQLSEGVMKEAMTVFMLFVVAYVAGALMGIAYGYEATQAIFESVAMVSNGGITAGIVSPGMPVGLEMAYIFLMWAGRLEFMTLLALLTEIAVSLKPRRKRAVRR